MDIQYVIANVGDDRYITVFKDGQDFVAGNDHPNFEAIIKAVLTNDEGVFDLFDVAGAAGREFAKITKKISTRNGRIYFDGDEIDNALTQQIVRCLEGEVQDLAPLVNFFERVMDNPNPGSVDQLYRWLQTHDFGITMDGLIVGYKGVRKTTEGYESISSGKALVDGVEHVGNIPYYPGAEVEMPRSEVNYDPAEGCSTGLHVGTWDYAHGFSRGSVFEVHVDPRDVVSVPTECGDQKMRVCRYQIVKIIDTPYLTPIISTPEEDDEECNGDDHCSCYYEGYGCCDCDAYDAEESVEEDEPDDECHHCSCMEQGLGCCYCGE